MNGKEGGHSQGARLVRPRLLNPNELLLKQQTNDKIHLCNAITEDRLDAAKVYLIMIHEIDRKLGREPTRIDDIIDENGDTLLHNAVDSGSIEAVKWVASDIGDLNKKNNSGVSPIQIAIDYNDIAIVKLLLAYGYAKDKESMSVFNDMKQTVKDAPKSPLENYLPANGIRDHSVLLEAKKHAGYIEGNEHGKLEVSINIPSPVGPPPVRKRSYDKDDPAFLRKFAPLNRMAIERPAQFKEFTEQRERRSQRLAQERLLREEDGRESLDGRPDSPDPSYWQDLASSHNKEGQERK